MAVLLSSPEQQFADANGKPYAGGSIATYVVGTSTPKATWSDPGGVTVNTNPLSLDSAGRALLFGDGAYRVVLRDSAGNLIWDKPASSLVSAAMAPVCLAADVATARTLLGIVDSTAGIAAATAAVATETAARIAADANIWAQTTTATTSLVNAIAAEETRARGVENAIWLLIPTGKIQQGFGQTDADGHHRVTFPTPFATLLSYTATVTGNGFNAYCLTASGNGTGMDVWAATYSQIGPQAAVGLGFSWIAIGT